MEPDTGNSLESRADALMRGLAKAAPGAGVLLFGAQGYAAEFRALGGVGGAGGVRPAGPRAAGGPR